jgi:hypothetical protein
MPVVLFALALVALRRDNPAHRRERFMRGTGQRLAEGLYYYVGMVSGSEVHQNEEESMGLTHLIRLTEGFGTKKHFLLLASVLMFIAPMIAQAGTTTCISKAGTPIVYPVSRSLFGPVVSVLVPVTTYYTYGDDEVGPGACIITAPSSCAGDFAGCPSDFGYGNLTYVNTGPNTYTITEDLAFTEGCNPVTYVFTLTLPNGSMETITVNIPRNTNPGAYESLPGAPGGVPFYCASQLNLAVLSGSNQAGQLLQPLGSPLAVQVTDGSGNPVSGVTVTFQIPQSQTPSGLAQGATLSSANARTDSNGNASVSFTLGDLVGPYQVTASCTNCSPASVTFTETATCVVSWSPTNIYHQSDSPPPVPASFGYTPVPNPLNYQKCPTLNSGCALTSSATMLTSLFYPTLVDSPARLDFALANALFSPDYAKGPISCKFFATEVCPASGSFPDWCEFTPAWGSIPQFAPHLQLIDSEDRRAITAPSGSNPNLSATDAYLQNHVCEEGDRVILQLSEPGTQRQHFVFVTGQTSDSNGANVDWTLLDPGWKQDSSGGTCPGTSNLCTLQGHLDGFNVVNSRRIVVFRQFTGVSGVRTYHEYVSPPNPTTLSITADSPVELLLTDAQGRELGNLLPGVSDVIDIPLASYFRDFPFADDDDDDGTGVVNGEPTGIKTAYVPIPISGTYRLQVTGTGVGEFSLTLRAVAEDGSSQVTALSGITNLGGVANYEVHYSPTSGSVPEISLIASSQGSLPSTQISTTASGLAYSRVSRTFDGTVTIKNVSTNPINGPLQIVLTSLSQGVTLANATGSFAGNAYVTVPLSGSLEPGQSSIVAVQFSNPSNVTISFTPVIYSGSF